MSRKSLESRTEPNITEAAERTGMLIRGLQNRLTDRTPEESTESLEWELQKCFATEAGPEVASRFPLNQLRRRVTEGVAEKILAGWDWSQDDRTTPIESEIIEVLIERVFERLIAKRAQVHEVKNNALPSKTSAKLQAAEFSA